MLNNENFKEHEHWAGIKNKIIRYYFYVNTGLNVFNNFKYLVAAIFGLYLVLHLKNGIWLGIMFVISVPILGVIGYYSVHHINKVMNWLDVRFGSYYTLRQIELLEEIKNAISKKDSKIVD
jgi:hypothetical protein